MLVFKNSFNCPQNSPQNINIVELRSFLAANFRRWLMKSNWNQTENARRLFVVVFVAIASGKNRTASGSERKSFQPFQFPHIFTQINFYSVAWRVSWFRMFQKGWNHETHANPEDYPETKPGKAENRGKMKYLGPSNGKEKSVFEFSQKRVWNSRSCSSLLHFLQFKIFKMITKFFFIVLKSKFS